MVSTIGSSLLLFAVGTLFVPAQCCEDPFIDVAGKCLYFVNEMNMSHFQSFELCEILHSRLAVITTPTQLYDVVQYIQLNNSSAKSYWLGGNDAFSEDNWQYAIDLPVPRGTPFWATHETSFSTWNQLPTNNITRNCLLLSEVQHYFFTDEDCKELYSPICENEPASSAVGRGSDERHDDYSDMSEIEPRATCIAAHYECPDQVCISANYLCDGDADCSDATDESYCDPDDHIIKDKVGTYGEVRSPGNEAGRTEPDLDLTWTVSVDPRVATNESYLTIHFVECQFYVGSTLSVRDGPDVNSVEIGSYTATQCNAQDITSSGSQLYFYFHSAGGSSKKSGMYFAWEAKNVQCGKNFVGTNGLISSVNYEGHYLDNIDCEWTIQSPPELMMPNTIVQLTILQFDTQPGNDYLEIRDGNDTSPMIASLSGHIGPQGPIRSTESQIHLHFHADDDFISYTGFQLMWHAVVCPKPYFVVKDLCIYYIWEDFTWGEASIACKQNGGHLARINDPENLRTIYTYLQENNIDQDSYWIDGKGDMEEGSWLWQDNTLVPTGTPFWGLNGDGRIQEPDNQGDESCLVMLGEGFHYFRDADCNQKYKSICMTDVVKQ